MDPLTIGVLAASVLAGLGAAEPGRAQGLERLAGAQEDGADPDRRRPRPSAGDRPDRDRRPSRASPQARGDRRRHRHLDEFPARFAPQARIARRFGSLPGAASFVAARDASFVIPVRLSRAASGLAATIYLRDAVCASLPKNMLDRLAPASCSRPGGKCWRQLSGRVDRCSATPALPRAAAAGTSRASSSSASARRTRPRSSITSCPRSTGPRSPSPRRPASPSSTCFRPSSTTISASCSRERPACSCPSSRPPTQFNMSYRGLGNPQEAEFVLRASGRPPDLDRLDRLSDALLHAAAAIAGGSAADPRRHQPALRARTRRRRSTSSPSGPRPTSRSAATPRMWSAATACSRPTTRSKGRAAPVSAAPTSATSGTTGSATMAHSRIAQGDVYLALSPDARTSCGSSTSTLTTRARAIRASSAIRNSSPTRTSRRRRSTTTG